MKKIIDGSKVKFINEDKNEMVMYIDYSTDECIWFFSDSDEVTITSDMELFDLLKNLMLQQYVFSDSEVLKCYKDDNKLVWYSDCYYNPDDEWSKNSISYLTIKYLNDCFKIKCKKPLDEVINRKNKFHVIAFSTSGNGKFAKNVKSGLTLQDDFVIMIYQQLIQKNKVKKL